jgi:hypothetical protein
VDNFELKVPVFEMAEFAPLRDMIHGVPDAPVKLKVPEFVIDDVAVIVIVDAWSMVNIPVPELVMPRPRVMFMADWLKCILPLLVISELSKFSVKDELAVAVKVPLF